MGRFEIARSAWQHDHSEALRIMDIIRRSHPGFLPAGKEAPAGYRLALRLLGFRMAETIADWRRRLFVRPPLSAPHS
jgi:hypothetical protein